MMTCSIDSLSFQQADHSIDIEHGENCLKDVIERLNSLPIQLHFVHTKDPLPESFILTYKEQPDAYANSFFPGTPPGDRKIFLHEASFLPAYRGSIFNILCHEFGHTLGMRHWNATSPGLEESSLLSVHYPLGSDNQLSVMGPYEHPGTLHFHPDDEKWLKEFYGKENKSYIQGYKIVDYPVDNVMSGKRT
ncbi:hypothetical protein F5Y02DRAFT_393132 [Annulohypoxylon stygium]|nr:hypothetical protein F5Y02DRAFT_393132 [Annulohypoxylon stygium]